MAENTCNGLLKQQIVDENGLYKWELKYFSLDILHNILIIYPEDYSEKIQYSDENDLIICRLSLNGSKYAKEWSASMIGSYGFDLLWSSGRIWSFLAEDEGICHQWVRCINQAIECSSNNNHEDQHRDQESQKNVENLKPFQSPHPQQQEQHSLDEFTTSVTQIEELSPQKLHDLQQQQQHRTPVQTTQRYRQPDPATATAATVAAAMRERDLHQTFLQNRFTTHEGSYISSIPPHSSPSDISPESNTTSAAAPEHKSRERYISSSLEPYNLMSDESTSGGGGGGATKGMKIERSSNHNTSLPGTVGMTASEEEIKLLRNQLASMTERCQHYQNLSERYLKETDLANQQLEQVLTLLCPLLSSLLLSPHPHPVALPLIFMTTSSAAWLGS
jgi:hypothetical protein